MSTFYIQQHLLSGNGRTIVKDEKGTPLYLMVGRWGTRGDVLSLYAMNGEIVASIKQVSFGLGSRFDLYDGYKKVGTLQRIFSTNIDFYYIHHLHWTVVGDIQNHHYTIHNLSEKIMTMEKAYLLTGDFYELEVTDDDDAPICICIAAVLDYWLIPREPKKQKSHFRDNLLNWGTN